ncbi:hypothetical protein [Planktotalea sp.]|uniref:hypothetical protein n=1 Tax=Planktotalea sp. TaxID=2029877 RepID=UPI0032977700
MPRWLLWTPLVVLTVAAGLFGFRMGWIAATITETDVIDRYAAHYLSQDSARSATACHAVPSTQKGVWLVVICGEKSCEATQNDDYSEYHANRLGRLVHAGDPQCGRKSERFEA